MKETRRPATDIEKLWQGFDEEHRLLVLCLAYAEPPVSIDLLSALSGAPVREILGVISALKKKRLVLEKREYGPGLYFPNGADLKEFVEKQVSREESNQALRKLIEFYRLHGKGDEEQSVRLSEFYLALGDIGGGIEFIKQAADYFYCSGEKEQAKGALPARSRQDVFLTAFLRK
jgi:hypothetical protein